MLEIEEGDHFKAKVGCQDHGPYCDTIFTVGYENSEGQRDLLGRWRQTDQDRMEGIDLDLSQFAGQKVRFTLSINIFGDRVDERDLVWFMPRIENER